MRIITALGLTVALTLAVSAQQRGGGQQGGPQGAAQQGGAQRGGGGGQQQAPSITTTKIVTAAELATIVAGTPKDRNGTANFIHLAPYNINMEHRLMGQAASIHETEAEMFYVIDGAGTLVTGGKLTEEKRTNPENLTGSGIEGGISRKVAKGDWILVPAGEPHWYPNVEAGGLTLMALHLPKKIE